MSLIPPIPMIWIVAADLFHTVFASVTAWLADFANAAAPAAIAALWQGTAIALILGLCLRFASSVRVHLGAAQRFAVWAAAFVTIAVLPFLPLLPIRGSFDSSAIVPSDVAPPAPWFHFPSIQIDESWAIGLAVVWLAASLVRAAALVRHSTHLRRLWSSAAPVVVTSENLRGLLAPTSGARRPIQLCTTRELDRPSVIGFFAPRILIPEWLFSRLTADELEHVVLHEAEHLRRGDDWINLLQKLALVLFPLNPALIWIERRLCREREMACDEGVVRRTQAPRAYAESLANLAGHAMAQRHAHALSLGAFDRRSELTCRVSSLLTRKPELHPVAARTIIGVAACGLLAVSLELARCPQMIAFVPASPAASLVQADSPAAQGDRVFREPTQSPGISGFRALQAKAVLPPASVSSRRAYGPAPYRTKNPNSPGSSSTHDRLAAGTSGTAVPLLQNMVRRGSAVIGSLPEGSSAMQSSVAQQASATNRQMQAAAEPQVVVFTAWEQIEARNAEPIADYDTGAAQTDANDPNGAAQNPQQQRATAQITVTRLIFWIAPRQDTSNTAPPKPRSPRPASSNSLQLPFPIPESGWLVFQL